MRCKRCSKMMDREWYIITKGYCLRCKMDNGGIRGIIAGVLTNIFKKIWRNKGKNILDYLKEVDEE